MARTMARTVCAYLAIVGAIDGFLGPWHVDCENLRGGDRTHSNKKPNLMDEATLTLFGRLGISLAIGMLVGLQREMTDNRLAGVRTIALTGLAGTLTALVDHHSQSGGWIIAAGIFAVGAIIVVSEMRLSAEQDDVGMTTAIAVMIVYLGWRLRFRWKPNCRGSDRGLFGCTTATKTRAAFHRWQTRGDRYPRDPAVRSVYLYCSPRAAQ